MHWFATIVVFLAALFVCPSIASAQKEKVFEEAKAHMAKEQKGRQYFREAEDLASKQKYKEALPLYEKAIDNLDVFKHVALFNMAMTYKNLKRHQDSISTLLQVIPLLSFEKKEQQEQIVQVHRLIADQSSMLEKWDFAAYHYEKIRTLTKDRDPAVAINLAKVLLNWGDPLPLSSSRKIFQHILDHFPQEFDRDKMLSCDFGAALAKLGEADECSDQLTRCRSNHPRDYSLHVSMATRLASSSPSQALLHLELVTSAPAWYSNEQLAPQVVYRLGLVYRALGRIEDEKQLYHSAVHTWSVFRHELQRPQFLVRPDTGPALPLIAWYHPEVYELSVDSSSSKSQIIGASVSTNGETLIDNDLPTQNQTSILHEFVSNIVSILESNFTAIQSEVLGIVRGDGSSNHSLPDMEGLVDQGRWSQIPIYRNGRKFLPLWKPEMLPSLAPTLLGVAKYIYGRYAKHMPLGAIEVSTLKGGTNLRPHCGPTNHKIRFHLGIKIPTSDSRGTADAVESDQRSTLEVAGHVVAWEQGRVLAFDDSFEHAVRSPSTQDRIVLIVDVWHPMISARQKQSIRNHFRYSASDQ